MFIAQLDESISLRSWRSKVQIFLNIKSHYSFRLMVRTIPFHGIDMGSNLIKSTRLKFTFFQSTCLKFTFFQSTCLKFGYTIKGAIELQLWGNACGEYHVARVNPKLAQESILNITRFFYRNIKAMILLHKPTCGLSKIREDLRLSRSACFAHLQFKLKLKKWQILKR